MVKKSAFIRDGQERTAYLAETPLHPAVRFVYRPVLVADRTEFLHELDKLSPRLAEKRSAQMLRAQIHRWDLTDENDYPAEVSVDNLLHLQPSLQMKLFNVVLGFAAGDDDPEAGQRERDERAGLLSDAAAENRHPGDLREERDLKN